MQQGIWPKAQTTARKGFIAIFHCLCNTTKLFRIKVLENYKTLLCLLTRMIKFVENKYTYFTKNCDLNHIPHRNTTQILL
jgi:hypothetical protein